MSKLIRKNLPKETVKQEEIQKKRMTSKEMKNVCSDFLRVKKSHWQQKKGKYNKYHDDITPSWSKKNKENKI
jgi:hypothetical protein